MNEFELQAFERELEAWRRRIDGCHPPPALSDELHAAEAELARARRQEIFSGMRVQRHLARMRALWDYLQPDHAGVDESP
jgi:hypothetical protein